MANFVSSVLRPMSAEQHRAAAGQFERAKQVIATGNYDYGIQLLLTCCRLDPGNLIYRQALRQTEKAKYQNNLRGRRFAALRTWTTRLRMSRALRAGDHLQVLEHGEKILMSNPWDVGAHRAMAEAFDELGQVNPAVWLLEQAYQLNPKNLHVNRALARLYEKRGNFTQAAGLWELVRQADPTDVEAQRKAKDLAASETIARGRYSESLSGTAEQASAETAEQPAAPSDKPGLQPGLQPRPDQPARVDRFSREVAQVRAKIEAEPTNPHHYLQLAGVYRRAEQMEQAKKVLEQGLPLTGNNFHLAVELADLVIEPFRANLAVTEGKLRAQPQDEELCKLRQRLLKEINTRELDLFRQKAERYPTDMSFRFEMGVRLFRAGQGEEAIKELQTARTDPRQLWRALMYLGYCFKGRNNWRLAQRNFEEALQHVPPAEEASRKEVLYQLAQGTAEAGDLAKAVELAYELANLDFAFRDIGQLLDTWQARLQEAGKRAH